MKYPEINLLEVGPGQGLCTLARQQSARGAERLIVASTRAPTEPVADEAVFLTALGRPG